MKSGTIAETGWPAYIDAPLARPLTRSAIVTVGLFAVTFDLALRSGIVGAAGALSIVIASGALLTSGRLRSRHAYFVVTAAPAFGIWLTVRASGWLLFPDLLAACGLVVLGASLGPGGNVWDLTVPQLLARASQAIVQGLRAPGFLASSNPGRRAVPAVVRGAIFALPILVVLGALLASADVVFASFIRLDAGNVTAHLVLIVIGALGMTALLRLASLEHVEAPTLEAPKLGATEWTVILSALSTLLAAFAAARVVAMSEGGRRVITSAGLTYAEYARSGFFQLLGAAFVTVCTLLVLRAVADRSRHHLRFAVLSLTVVVLTLGVVASAFHRLLLYEGAFGLTMLRLYAHTTIVWVAIVLVMVALYVIGVAAHRRWILSGAAIAGLVLLFALNVVNPEALVARHNLSERTPNFDAAYMNSLSDDAVPIVAEHKDVRTRLCDRSGATSRSWAAYNLARARAAQIRSDLCTSQGG